MTSSIPNIPSKYSERIAQGDIFKNITYVRSINLTNGWHMQ